MLASLTVFFHKHGCEVTLNGKTILRGWRNPKNRLWRVKLVDDGWTTKLTIHDDSTRPPIPLTTTPTGIAMATPTTNCDVPNITPTTDYDVPNITCDGANYYHRQGCTTIEQPLRMFKYTSANSLLLRMPQNRTT